MLSGSSGDHPRDARPSESDADPVTPPADHPAMSDDNPQEIPQSTDHRLAEIRKRIQEDFYLQGPVLDVVAARIARSGDWAEGGGGG